MLMIQSLTTIILHTDYTFPKGTFSTGLFPQISVRPTMQYVLMKMSGRVQYFIV